MNEEILNLHIAELRKQRDALQKQVDALSNIVIAIPSLIARTRLDAKFGIPTVYDYKAHEHALNFRNFYQF